ncbi:hypothetical protein DM01DRAFT_302142, partial [Hesseltinella vesiculosa]
MDAAELHLSQTNSQVARCCHIHNIPGCLHTASIQWLRRCYPATARDLAEKEFKETIEEMIMNCDGHVKDWATRGFPLTSLPIGVDPPAGWSAGGENRNDQPSKSIAARPYVPGCSPCIIRWIRSPE